MSLEVFEKLESKVQQAIDTITLLQMEIEELKEKNNSLSQEVQNAQHSREELERENHQLREQQNGWQDRSAGASGTYGRSVIPNSYKRHAKCVPFLFHRNRLA
ncbi:cell division protein ZapB [Enterobacter cancerogenus]|uniref:Cell division protein ZapB n=1 Tax=Enterobacter cancerogenus TaxID=69218 RepID=A0A484YMD7_9ENTR|nr:cell division protein ZapB [Enterobacter cancerogenus]